MEDFATELQTIRDGFEAKHDQTILPHTLGQILMTCLPVPAMDGRLSIEQKSYWMEVAAHMGPDWIAELRRVAAFMDKIDQF